MDDRQPAEAAVLKHARLNPDLSPPPVRTQVVLLLAIAALSLLAGLGMREPMPPDEPRFVLAARQMVETGQWMFPHRGSEIYAEKPPMFMWLQAASYQLVRNWSVAFLLPSLLAALLTLALAGDLARRLWGSRAAAYAIAALFVCVQFGLQAKRGQIDMVLTAMTTLSLWALLRYLLERGDPRLLALGTFAAGLGTVTKGVGFLPLLVFLPWLLVRGNPALPRLRGAHALAGVGGFVLGAGAWLAPMLWTALSSHDPALHAYAREMLFKQTGERYANAWHHVQPPWYYLRAMLTLWLPGVLLAPWLLPAWWRRLRERDAGFVLLLGWSLLVLLFFSASPGKREVYILPALPALCVAAAPLLPALLQRRGMRIALWGYVLLWALAALGLVAALSFAPAPKLAQLAAQRGLDGDALSRIVAGLSLLGATAVALAIWQRRNVARAVVGLTAALWLAHGLWLAPALSDDSSSRALMRQVDERIGPQAELGLLAWREQMLLQAQRPVVEFGFKRDWHLQWRDAAPWLAAAPEKRWLLALRQAAGPCVDPDRIVPAGRSNRREWWLVPGTALKPGCTTPPFGEDTEAD